MVSGKLIQIIQIDRFLENPSKPITNLVIAKMIVYVTKGPKIEISKKWVCFPGEKTRKNLNFKNGCVLKDGPIRVNTKESGQR